MTPPNDVQSAKQYISKLQLPKGKPSSQSGRTEAGKTYRVDYAQPLNGPHKTAEEYQEYVEWLSKSRKPASAPQISSLTAEKPEPAPSQTTEGYQPTNVRKPNFVKKKGKVIAATTKIVRGSKKPVQADHAIPAQPLNITLEKLIRVDTPATAAKQPYFEKPKPVDKGTQPAENIYSGNAAVPTDGFDPTEGLIPKVETVEQFNTQDDLLKLDLPVSVVAWDVEDFVWSETVEKMLSTRASTLIRAQVDRLIDNSIQRIGVVGSNREQGTTTVAICVARALAAKNKQVLLVDADISKPDLSRQVGLDGKISWSEAARGHVTTNETIIKSNQRNISIMPLNVIGPKTLWPKFIYDSLAQLIDRVQFCFDVIIFDFGPATQLTDELSKSDMLVDASLLVHNVGKGSHANYTWAQNRLESFGINNIVVAENFSKNPRQQERPQSELRQPNFAKNSRSRV